MIEWGGGGLEVLSPALGMLPGLLAGFAAPKVKLVWVAVGLTQLKAGLLLADGADCAVEASLNSVPLAAPADMGEIDIARSDSVDASGFVWICSSTAPSQGAHELPHAEASSHPRGACVLSTRATWFQGRSTAPSHEVHKLPQHKEHDRIPERPLCFDQRATLFSGPSRLFSWSQLCSINKSLALAFIDQHERTAAAEVASFSIRQPQTRFLSIMYFPLRIIYHASTVPTHC